MRGTILAMALWLLPFGLAQPRTLALVVGVNQYRTYPETSPLPPLSYAESDAQKFAEALQQDAQHWRLARLRLLLGDLTTKTALEAELRDLARWVGPEDTLVFYYSGHGRPNRLGQASVMPYDAKLTDDETWLPLGRIQQVIEGALAGRGRYLMLVDACYSGQSLPGTRSFEVPGAKALPRVEIPRPRGVGALLAASSATQLSWEDAEKGGGVFTAYLLEALGGQADQDGDGIIKTSEVYAYVAGRVAAYTRQKHQTQNPQLFARADFALTLDPLTAARSRLARLKLGGHIGGEQFDALSLLLEQPRPPEDLRLYLQDRLSDGQFVDLVQMGAVAGVPASPASDRRLLEVGRLHRQGRLRHDQLWALRTMVLRGRASWWVSQFLSGKVGAAAFLDALGAGRVAGVPR